jgi:ADP-ribose pyrophosphatase YjhB (NUDIX family)
VRWSPETWTPRIAAAREAHEESGLILQPEDMVLISHWTTPEAEPRRFSTWIYAAPVGAGQQVAIDGSEIHDHLWLTIDDALARHARGELPMLPPTLVTLLHLSSYASIAELLAEERHSSVPEVLPVFAQYEDSVVVMFAGDAGYASASPACAGPRHRAVLIDQSWEYVHEGVDLQFAPLAGRRC